MNEPRTENPSVRGFLRNKKGLSHNRGQAFKD